jgi:multimeric flavodoxin WrbA
VDAIGALRRAELATAEQRELGALSDRMIDELKRADLIVIGSPMHNFGISSHLKAWFDTIIRAGKTFSYEGSGGSCRVNAAASLDHDCALALQEAFGALVADQAGVAYKRFRRRLRCFALTVA